MEPLAKRETAVMAPSSNQELEVEAPASPEAGQEQATRAAPLHRGSTNTSQNDDHGLSLREVDPVAVRLDRLSVSVDESPNAVSRLFAKPKTPPGHSHVKTILDDISADMPSGTLTAIIGGSGSGKTSLLNSMSGRIQTNNRLITSGRTLFNGSEDASHIRSAYVIQQDILLHTLTVRETLTYAAQLRLPSSVSAKEKKQLVEDVILELGLKEAADTRIGNHEHKGCSGGEKRRTSIGVQLLSNPSLLWLDEPTTGLDSTSAFQVIRTLQTLASQGRTIIVTIHQPRSEIWDLFDNVILLSRGKPAYAGSAKDCLSYFAKLGHEMPPFTNPAEYLIDVVSVDNRSVEAEAAAQERVGRVIEAWRANPNSNLDEKGGSRAPSTALTKSQGKERPVNRTSFIQQTWVLTARTWTVTIRDPMGKPAMTDHS